MIFSKVILPLDLTFAELGNILKSPFVYKTTNVYK
jgi:hypothetical protein